MSNCEELLEGLIEPIGDMNDDHQTEYKRERLAALVLGGQAKQYLGKNVSAEDVDNMDSQEINRLYTRYEARLGSCMTKTLGQTAIQLYSTIAGKFLPIPQISVPMLANDLEADPFVSHALTTTACELYYRYGFYLAPLTAAMTTVKYCQFGNKETLDNKDGERIESTSNCGKES